MKKFFTYILLCSIPLLAGCSNSLSTEELVFTDLVHCEDEVREDIERQYPLDSSNSIYWSWPIAKPGSFNRQLYQENADKNLALSKTAYQACYDNITEKYQISTGELQEIKGKALQEDWIEKLKL